MDDHERIKRLKAEVDRLRKALVFQREYLMCGRLDAEWEQAIASIRQALAPERTERG